MASRSVPARGAGGRFVKGGGSKGGTGAKVTDKDRGFKKLVKRLRDAAAKPVGLTIGIHEEDGAKTHAQGETAGEDLTVAQIGEIHEFGLGVPRRSFLIDWVDENKAEHEKAMRRVSKLVVEGKLEPEQAFNRLGVLFVAQVQKRIAQNIPPPLAQSTIDRKGSSVALIDTEVLRSSITYRIIRK